MDSYRQGTEGMASSLGEPTGIHWSASPRSTGDHPTHCQTACRLPDRRSCRRSFPLHEGPPNRAPPAPGPLDRSGASPCSTTRYWRVALGLVIHPSRVASPPGRSPPSPGSRPAALLLRHPGLLGPASGTPGGLHELPVHPVRAATTSSRASRPPAPGRRSPASRRRERREFPTSYRWRTRPVASKGWTSFTCSPTAAGRLTGRSSEQSAEGVRGVSAGHVDDLLRGSGRSRGHAHGQVAVREGSLKITDPSSGRDPPLAGHVRPGHPRIRLPGTAADGGRVRA